MPKIRKVVFVRENEPDLNYYKGINDRFKKLKELYTSYKLREFNYRPPNVLESVKNIE